MDLIYEGITTSSEWDGKVNPLSQNGPDLRRDYDLIFILEGRPGKNVRMDLIYEGITTRLRSPFQKHL